MKNNEIYKDVKFPRVLTIEEEQQYFKVLRMGDFEARNKLIMHNLRLVISIAGKIDTFVELEDLVSIGTTCLIKAVDSYKLEKGVNFSHYAATCIKNGILMYLKRSGNRNYYKNISFNQLEDENIKDYFPVNDVPSVERDIVKEDTINEFLELFQHTLSYKEQKTIELRYGFKCEPKNQTEVSKVINVSQSYVSRLEKTALKKLKKELLNHFNSNSEKLGISLVK